MKAANLLLLFFLLILTSFKSFAQDTTSNSNWLGRWERAIWLNHASLEIKSIKNDTLTFSLIAGSGGHVDELEGEAVMNDRIAIYYAPDEVDSCTLKFTLSGDSFIIIDEEKYCNKAMGVAYKGRYVNSAYSHEDDDEPHNFAELGILTEKEDSLLLSLTGGSYSMFFNSTQLTNTNTDIDGLHAKVFSSGIRGLYTYMENIIMVDDNNNMWAAVIDVGRVLYFTNSKTYMGELPKTIEKWRTKFKDHEVVYKSKP